jgi:rod shape-determining protein MreC
MLKRPHYIAFIAVLAFVLVVLNLPNRTVSQLKVALGGLFLPLLGLTSSAQRLGEGVGNAVVPRKVLAGQIADLLQENQELQLQLMQSAALWQENARLRAALDWEKQIPWNMKLGRVVFRDPSNWWRTLHIDLGSRDGVQTNMPVLTVDGLVGRIHQVSHKTSQVVLVGDPNCRVAALVEETRDHGIIGPGSANLLDRSLVDLQYLLPDHRIQPGYKVVTSGIPGGIFPKGIPIGTVLEVTLGSSGIVSDARVKLGADFSHLEEVWVIIP